MAERLGPRQDQSTGKPVRRAPRPIHEISFEENFGEGRLLRRGLPMNRMPEGEVQRAPSSLPKGLKITEID
jgi:hypothetical protein